MRRSISILLIIGLSLAIFALDQRGFFKKRVTFPQFDINPSQKTISDKYELAPEILEIKSAQSLDQQVPIYKRLIERVGPIEAQEQLQKSGLPFDGESHLLNHTVGDFLYEKYGASGLSNCREYFLSSCYHGFVIRALADGGVDLLSEVVKTCQEKGEHVAIQCAHAIGHGFLAFDGYKYLTKALGDCDTLGEKSIRFRVYNCYDGVFMENVFAVHENGQPSPDRWLNQDDPIYPCNEEKIPPKYLRACWSNQPSWMYQLFQADLHQVAQQCLNLENQEYQTTCFDALARQIHPLTRGSVDETFRMCSLMPPPWIDPCIVSISKAFFSVGDRQAPFQICSKIHSKESCYKELISIISLYIKDQKERGDVCDMFLDKEWVDKCKST